MATEAFAPTPNDFDWHHCAICHGRDFTSLYQGIDAHRLPVRLAVCECGLVQLNPRLSSEGLHRFYASSEYSHTYIEHNRRDPKWRARKETIARQLLDAVEEERALAGVRLLDIGCGDGMLLREALRRGARASGVEPGREQAAQLQADGFAVTSGTVQDLPSPRPTFDVVTLSHVLEHVDDAVEFLAS